MGLATRCSVDWMKINCSPWLPILFSDNVHPAAPRYRCVVGNSLQHPETDITFDVLAHLLLPVGGNGRWAMYSDRNCIFLHEYPEGLRPFHHRERLELTGIECTCRVVVPEPDL